MKVAERNATIIRSNDFEEEEFVIETTAESFALLSKSIYSDPVLAVIRELSTNARDSHVEANKADVPFYVSMPGKYDPEFRIRDYGTGIHPDNIKAVYKRYFVSTRTASDAYTGMLGLGSKSPLAYTDNFSVINYYDGIKYTYSIFIKANGKPAIALMAKDTTTEGNGLEIKVAVQPKNYEEFHQKGTKIYRFFRVQPTNFPVERPIPWLFGNNWDLFHKEIDDGTTEAILSKPHAIMGDVVYPIDLYKVGFSYLYLNTPLLLRFNIGDLEITGNREALHYSQRTITNLKSAFENISAKISKKLEETIDKFDSHWEAACYVDSIDLSIPRDCDPQLYRGDALKSIFNLNCVVREYNSDSGRSRRIKYEERAVTTAKYDKKFIENDLTDAKMHRYVRWNMLTTFKGQTFVVFNPEDRMHIEALGVKPECIIKASDLPTPPKKEYKRTADSGIKTLVYTDNSFYLRKLSRDDVKQGGVYIETHRGTFSHGGLDYSSNRILDVFIRPLERLGIKPPAIVSIPQLTVPRFKKNKWVDLATWVKNCLNELPNKVELERQLAWIHVVDLEPKSNYKVRWQIPEKSAKNNRFVKYLHEVNERCDIFNENSKAKIYYDLKCKMESDYQPLVNPDLECYNGLVEDFPLLKYVTRNSRQVEIIDFIRYVDKCAK